MFRLDADRAVGFCDGLRRRDLLHAGALAGLGLGLTDFLPLKAQAGVAGKDVNCILLFLVGGPSQLDTWDMKPDAPSEIRGPYRPIRTNVPGIRISEIFPRMARHADKYAILRGCYHTGAAVHSTGHQVMQTGRVFHDDVESPHIGCVVSQVKGSKGGVPAHVLLPGPIGNTGGDLPHGQTAGFLGKTHDPWIPASPVALDTEPQDLRDRYGMNRFGQSCLRARRMVEAGVRFVTVNMFDTVFDQITWDSHGFKPFSPIGGYRDRVGPMFDMAYSSLLEDLSHRGLLSSTMVVAMGEFGRTPKINPAGGRDHWPQCFSILMAGGPLKGGQVIGSSDDTGASPKDRPTSPAEIAATIYHGLGIPPVDQGAQPIQELL